jgi:hypothetical protein
VSLKRFHMLFVIVATIVALFCAAQAFASYRAERDVMMALLSVSSLAGAALLVRAEVLFLRRCREGGVR